MPWATETVATVGKAYTERGEGREELSDSLEKCKSECWVFLIYLEGINIKICTKMKLG